MDGRILNIIPTKGFYATYKEEDGTIGESECFGIAILDTGDAQVIEIDDLGMVCDPTECYNFIEIIHKGE